MSPALTYYEIGGLTVCATSLSAALYTLVPLEPFRIKPTKTPDIYWKLDELVGVPNTQPSFDMPVGMGHCRLYVEKDRIVCELVSDDGVSAWMEYHPNGNTVHFSRMPSEWLHFALWLAYNMPASAFGRYAFHAAAVVYEHQASIFLGESGTGKSTHARQWMAALDDCWLLNDDSPVVASVDGAIWVYGSPWSGKIPCYLTDRFPLRGVARLRQAPQNNANRLRPLEAIAALVPSFPPMLVHAEPFRSRMLQLVESLVEQVPVLRVDCLPDTDAARCCLRAMEQA